MLKRCADAERQVAWLRQERELLSGLRCVPTRTVDSRCYVMPFLEGTPGHLVEGLDLLERLHRQVMHWSTVPADNAARWDGYLERLAAHVAFVRSPVCQDALNWIASEPPFPSSWCHGDLTLENVILDEDGTVFLLDPNYAPDLYQSFLLDLGKLLQSTHTGFHRNLQGLGVDLSTQDRRLRDLLAADGLLEDALRACVSHLIRLLRYLPERRAGIEAEILALRSGI